MSRSACCPSSGRPRSRRYEARPASAASAPAPLAAPSHQAPARRPARLAQPPSATGASDLAASVEAQRQPRPPGREPATGPAANAGHRPRAWQPPVPAQPSTTAASKAGRRLRENPHHKPAASATTIITVLMLAPISILPRVKCSGSRLDDARLDRKVARTPLRCGHPHRDWLPFACSSFPKRPTALAIGEWRGLATTDGRVASAGNASVGEPVAVSISRGCSNTGG